MITEAKFRAFEEIRKLGEYNMITEYELVMIELGLTKDEYIELLSNYDDMRDDYDNS